MTAMLARQADSGRFRPALRWLHGTIVLLLLARVAFGAQSPPLWNGLSPGPFLAGFRYVEYLDGSRVWTDERLRSPTLSAVPHTRPIRISVWYPAQAQGSPLQYRDYVFYRNSRPEFAKFEQLIAARDSGYLTSFTGQRESEKKRLLDLPMAATYQAKPADGQFPVVLYFMGLNDLSPSNAVLWEYLATQGFVVVTITQIGRSSSSLDTALTQADIETQVSDMELALAVAGSLSFADRSNIAVVGHSIGGIEAILLAMKNPDVKGVVSLDGSFGNKRFAALALQSPFWKEEELNKPFLDLRRSLPDYDDTVLQALTFSNRFLLQFTDVEHGDFTTTPAVESLFGENAEGRTTATSQYRVQFYKLVCRAVASFLATEMHGDHYELAHWCDGTQSNGVKASNCKFLEGRPALVDLAKKADQSGVGAMVQQYGVELTESRTNQLGYLLLSSGQITNAIEVFRVNTERHPTSSNAYDSLAEAEVAAQDFGAARRDYDIELRLLNSDASMSPELRERLRSGAEKQLKQLNGREAGAK